VERRRSTKSAEVDPTVRDLLRRDRGTVNCLLGQSIDKLMKLGLVIGQA
jgi:hypothetical protein